MEKISIPVITILSYIIGEFFKLVVLRKKKRYKYIPLIVGIVSGLASTGTNELIKQIKGEKKNGRDL